jgi:hypothetical protein
VSRIWQACQGGEPQRRPPRPRLVRLRGRLLRLVESQEKVATGAIVDSAAEQSVLEDLLEASKPPLHEGSEALHYLLKTPFRYPPLPHGSRFGTRLEPALFYGSLREQTVLAEAAYYRFWFWFGMVVPPPMQQLITQHTVFQAGYDTARGVKLQAPPFDAYTDVLRSPDDYTETQALGTALRAARVHAFQYLSARDRDAGTNIAVISPRVFKPPNRILGREEWTCTTMPARVSFTSAATRATREFLLEQFLVEGVFPDPAA